MMTTCLQSVVTVLERQYSRYFTMNLTEKLREETASTRSHNIDSEEIMGMFSAAKQRAPNATLCLLSSRMRACKNQTVDYLDSLSAERRDHVLKKAVRLGRFQRDRKKKTQKQLKLDLINRQKEKQQARDEAERRKMEKSLKDGGLEGLQGSFPGLDYSQAERITEILEGKVVGKQICHMWLHELVPYHGNIRKLNKNTHYKIGHWTQEEGMDNATDYQISMYSLAIDLIQQDLVFDD